MAPGSELRLLLLHASFHPHTLLPLPWNMAPQWQAPAMGWQRDLPVGGHRGGALGIVYGGGRPGGCGEGALGVSHGGSMEDARFDEEELHSVNAPVYVAVAIYDVAIIVMLPYLCFDVSRI